MDYLLFLLFNRPFSLIAGLLLGFLIVRAFRVARQYERAVIFRLGKYARTSGPGLYLVIPLVESVTEIDIRTATVQDVHQESITKDNVPTKVSVVLQYKVVDAKASIIEVENAKNAGLQLALVSLRDKIGQHSLDEILKDQERISKEMLAAIADTAKSWGLSIERVQMKNVEIPESMQRAMAQEAEALREQRARVIKAEGEKKGAQLLKEAADLVTENPAALELRRMQMITEVGAEQNTSTIILFPSEFVSMAHGIARLGEVMARNMSTGKSVDGA